MLQQQHPVKMEKGIPQPLSMGLCGWALECACIHLPLGWLPPLLKPVLTEAKSYVCAA